MKKLIVLLSVLFLSARLFARDGIAILGLNSSFQGEVVTIKDTPSQVLFAPSLGLFFSGNYFEDDENLGFGFSVTYLDYQLSSEDYISGRLLLGPSIRPNISTIPIAFLSGVILQPEYENLGNSDSSFHFLLGMGLDLQFGSKYGIFGYGGALSIGLYPVMFANTKIAGKSKSLDIEKYGRITVGLSLGLSIANNHLVVE